MRKYLLLLFIIVISPLLISQYMPKSVYLHITGENKECFFPIKDNETLSISFIHSVELTREIDFYRVEGNSFILFKTLTKTAGWGLPSTEKNFSITTYKGEEWFEYRIIRYLKAIEILGYPLNKYSLETENYSINLTEFGNRLRIDIVRENKIYGMFRGCLSEK
ncbi:hypothetical protein Asulf_01943 [Archaeoglobus sulfaticallidus PM70-1]|uniref:DUF1850 domain-containing protein n=1 Tax=Archaeoglobus sulfaticallidus PM70-1 TaxID=387631 RepID=N0BE57_9EURY|nr:DUF1850 domain-containing protein [Archaeoglobus sulfaticallidus]AGK61909.1 hypothetical protein Asulf_01943 [Archaeoglobus sulfaticallidus PM70-1]